jgi:hypothetical protein
MKYKNLSHLAYEKLSTDSDFELIKDDNLEYRPPIFM